MLYLLALFGLLCARSHGDRTIFSIDQDHLSYITSHELNLLENVLQTDGALAVSNMDQGCASAIRRMRLNAPSCLGEFLIDLSQFLSLINQPDLKIA